MTMQPPKHNDWCIAWRNDGYESWRIALIWKESSAGGRWEMFTTDYDLYLLGRLPPHYPLPVPESEIINWCAWIEDAQCFLSWCYGELDTF